MRKTMAAGMLLAVALPLLAQAGDRQPFDLFGGVTYGDGSMRFASEGAALKVSGTAHGSGYSVAGYVISGPEDLPFSGRNRLIVRVSGIKPTDEFDVMKLLKLELDSKAQSTISPGMKSYNDPHYINARNGEAEFDISRMGNIRKLNLVFYNCTVSDVKIEVFYE
jgi:hypothetical protein